MKLKDTIHFNWYKHLFIVLVIGLCVTASAAVTEADILDVLGNLEQMSGFLSRFLKPDFAYIPKLIGPMISTLQMSVTGTALGVLFAVPVAFLGTTVVTGNRLVTSAIRFFLDIVRTIPNLLLAALMVAIVGIGEFTGVMTIAVFTSGPHISQHRGSPHIHFQGIEGITSHLAHDLGANKVQVAFWSVAPQIMSQVAGYTFYALEVNVRASAVLGYVGAGGIGIILNSSLALLQYDRVSVIILLILAVVAAVDGLSEAIRRRLA